MQCPHGNSKTPPSALKQSAPTITLARALVCCKWRHVRNKLLSPSSGRALKPCTQTSKEKREPISSQPRQCYTVFQMFCSYVRLKTEIFFWQLHRWEAFEDTARNLCNPNIHYSLQKRRPLVYILSQINPLHSVTTIKVVQIAVCLVSFRRCQVRISERVPPINVFHCLTQSLPTNAAMLPLHSSLVDIW
jgi:hypothetical protein